MPRRATSPRVACGAGPGDEADPAEVVMTPRPDPHREPRTLKELWDELRKARLEVDKASDGVEARPVHGISGAQAFVENAGDDLDEGASEPGSTGGTDREH